MRIEKKTAYDLCIKEIGESDGEMIFTGYANTKNFVDHAKDMVLDGAYQKAIDRAIERGKMPKLLWSHDMSSMPVGTIDSMKEDEHGLLIKGRLADTPEGIKLYKLMKMGAIDSFSIGYAIDEEKWDKEKQVNYLIKIDVKEVSFVNLPCNEESTLQEVKSRLENKELPTKREVQNLLRQFCGFSKRQAESTMSQFAERKPIEDAETESLNSILETFTK